MKTALRLVVLATLLVAALPPRPLAAVEPPLKSGDRVVFLGGTFFERLQAYGLGEAALVAGYPDDDITFRNLGWSGDNVFGEARALFGSVEDGFQRLDRDVQAARPTVVVLNYGANEAHAGSAGLAAFQQGLDRLLDTLAGSKARIIVLLPQPYEDLGGDLPSPETYNHNLELYRGALRDAAARRELAVADLAAVAEAARRDLSHGQSLTDNGVHLTPRGYRALAAHLATALGAKHRTWHVDLDVAQSALEAVGCKVQSAVPLGENGAAIGVKFTVIDDVLELSQQNGYDSPTAQPQGTLRVRGLAAGDYELRIDGQSIDTASAKAWANGVALTQRGGQDQAEQLRQAVVAKNQLYFHRYRPQNETYLFLFRKHEQGNNAVEIPQFDPLVEEQDQRIVELRRSRPHTFELRRVEATIMH